MIKILTLPTRIISAFLDVLNTKTEVHEIHEFRIEIKRPKQAAFFYPGVVKFGK